MYDDKYEFDLQIPADLDLTDDEKKQLKDRFRAAIVEMFERRAEAGKGAPVGDIELVKCRKE